MFRMQLKSSCIFPSLENILKLIAIPCRMSQYPMILTVVGVSNLAYIVGWHILGSFSLSLFSSS